MENTAKPIISVPNISTPNVQIFETPKNATGIKKFLPKWFFSAKIILVILGLVILVEIGYAIKTFTTKVPEVTRLEGASDAKIVLVADKKSYAVGDEVTITVRIATGGYPTDGTDLVLRYDPEVLEPIGDDFFEEGLVYAEYPLVDIDEAEGILRVSGITSSSDAGFSGVGDFATLFMKAKKTGRTTISVDFKNGDTTDTNVIQSRSAKDLLTSVYNLDINIGNSSEQITLDESNSCDSFLQVCFNESGKQGVQECTRGKLDSNACTYDPYLTQSCEVCQVD